MILTVTNMTNAKSYVSDHAKRPEFTLWMAEVDAEVSRLTDGMSFLDFADQNFCCMFEDGVMPEDAAMEMLADEGYPLDD